jgi:hypothetical protein
MLPVPYAVRLNHKARHGATLRRRPFAYLHSLAREVGEFLFGAFLPSVA